jgi:hypothetical protein
VHIIFPDKQTVLTQKFFLPNPLSLGNLYLERVPENQNRLRDKILFPRDRLQNLSSRTFLATDTHLTDFGTIVVTVQISLNGSWGIQRQTKCYRLRII